MADRISEHISYKEATHSNTALRRGIDNIPDVEEIENIKINSFYRSPELNVAIGGSKTSQHCHGQAMDLDDTYGHRTNASMFTYIRNHLDFDQLIWEFGDDKNPAWIHVSYVSEDENRHRCLKAVKKSGKTTYELI